MSISRENVIHIAKLAKLKLQEEEVAQLLKDLDQIVQYVELLNEVDTTNVPPMSHVTVTESPLREDSVKTILSTAEALAEAPRQSGDSYAVPAFVDEG